jgi:hypothetical protein
MQLGECPVDGFAIQSGISLNEPCGCQGEPESSEPDEDEPVLNVGKFSAVKRPARQPWDKKVDGAKAYKTGESQHRDVGVAYHPVGEVGHALDDG